MMHYKETSNKLSSSRVIKFSLIGIITLIVLRFISFGLTSWLIVLIDRTEPQYIYKIDAFLKLADLLSIPIAAAIATVVTAVVARYGLREATGNVADGMINKDSTSGLDE